MIMAFLVDGRIHAAGGLCLKIQELDAPLMPAALEILGEKSLHYGVGELHAGQSRAKAEYVCIVVSAAQTGMQFRCSKGRSDAAVPVRRHGHAYARAADEYALRAVLLDGRAERMREDWVVAAVGRIRAVVDDFKAPFPEG